ncbi:hypothetical protein SK128_001973 [Halocaridina rubra]|uniref:Uncharacterized protein n=1 Tax=Halocaridina rubra TaxID=373956 RepID=A0AAN9AF61_HALRR
MDDTVSEKSNNSCWAKDELVFVDEKNNILKQQTLCAKESLNLHDADEPVSAAVSLVVSSARQGVVTLCANVAHILREKKRLQERVNTLEKQLLTLENSSSGISSVNGSCSVHCQASDLRSLQESPVSQRCGSAPASFIASGLKFLKTDCQSNLDDSKANNNNNVRDKMDNDDRYIYERGSKECQTSRLSMPETDSNLLLKANNDRKAVFVRGPRQTSTRSLNICQSLPKSSFVRRKYSTVSLRRVRRSMTSRQKSSSTCSTISFSSNTSSTFREEPRKGSESSSCIITVAEVHTPPSPQMPTKNTESEAIKLLAKALTTYLYESHIDVDRGQNASVERSTEAPDVQTSKMHPQTELCLPHPLAGCECDICLNLSADPNCHLYALSTGGGSLLPPGSKVLIEGERLGTVLYLGHDKHSSKGPRDLPCGTMDSSLQQEGLLRPVGVSVRLWAPDEGEVFVPINSIICQLDDECDLYHGDSLTNSDYEYLAVDSDDDCIFSNNDNSLECDSNLKAVSHTNTRISRDEKTSSNGYFIRSPSISSCGSDVSHSLGELSMYDLNCEDDEDLEIDDASRVHDHPSSKNSICASRLTLVHEGKENIKSPPCDEALFNTTFAYKSTDEYEYVDPRRLCNDKSASLCDTFDSAISLSFNKRFQHSEDSSEPSSMTGTDRESPHFGDTWDSGCSFGRGRCKSDSSGHFSDTDIEYSRLGNTVAKSLGDALDVVLEKHNLKYSQDSPKYKWNMNKNMRDDFILAHSQFRKRPCRNKEVFALPELSHKEGLCSRTYKISGSVADHSEV